MTPSLLEIPEVPPVMLAIAKCESGQRQFTSSGKVVESYTRDYGAFQISYRHIKEASDLGYDIMTENGNMGYALYLYRKLGTAPWRSSSKCWSGSDTS